MVCRDLRQGVTKTMNNLNPKTTILITLSFFALVIGFLDVLLAWGNPAYMLIAGGILIIVIAGQCLMWLI